MVCSPIYSRWYDKLTVSTHSGTAGAMWQVILGRAVTGLGGAGMVTLAAIIITGESSIPAPCTLI
jgi:hypothetical protein